MKNQQAPNNSIILSLIITKTYNIKNKPKAAIPKPQY